MAKMVLTEEEKKEQFDWYIEIAKNYSVKPLNLNAPKEEVYAEFIKRYMTKEMDQASKFYKVLEKSYATYKPEKLKDILSYEDIKIKKSTDLLELFFEDLIGSKQKFKNIVEFNETLTRLHTQKLEDVFGNIAFATCSYITVKEDSAFKGPFIKSMKDRGYVMAEGFQNIFIHKNPHEKLEIKKENQGLLLDAYKEIVRIYVDHYSDFVKKDRQTVEKFWDVVKLATENIEARLTIESKRSEEFLSCKAKLTNCFEVSLKKVFKNSRISELFEEFEAVKDATKRLETKNASESDKLLVNKFYKMIEKVGEVLSVVGKDGQPHPVNYYLATKFEPLEFIEIITYLQKKDIWTEEQRKLITQVKTLIRKNFDKQNCTAIPKSILGKDLNVKEVLDIRFKGVITRTKTSLVDLTDEKDYLQFVKNVEDVVKKYDFPHSEWCISLIGKEFIKGRQPVYYTEKTNEK